MSDFGIDPIKRQVEETAVGMVTRVRTDPEEAVASYLDHLEPGILREVARRLAELVPEDQTLSQLTAPKYRRRRPPSAPAPFEHLAPCGTLAAYHRHVELSEHIDYACAKAHWHAEQGYPTEPRREFSSTP